jgi:hypothetical protein
MSIAIEILGHCLFCGLELSPESRTMEDVFPKWLQREYGLVNEQLTLLNGTGVTYSQLVVPACSDCNNVHASQLEQRVKEDRATAQDMWIWLLKLQLGTMHWETSKPAARDRRDPAAEQPILSGDAFDVGFLHTLFDVLKRPDPQFAPDPLGSVFCFPTDRTAFYYADKLYRHPQSDSDADNYSASCIVIHGRCWIALFDDAGLIHDNAVSIEIMERQVADGKDPIKLFAELMFLRACLDWTPSTLIVGPQVGAAQGVAFTLPMGPPRDIERRQEDLDVFYASLGFRVGDD